VSAPTRRLTVKDVVDYEWCPAKLWFKYYGPRLSWRPRHYTGEERIDHDETVRIVGEALGRGMEECTIIREPLLHGITLPVTGRPDMIAYCPDTCVAVEVKTRRSPWGLAELQAGLYKTILEEQSECRNRETVALIVEDGTARRVDPDRSTIALKVRRALEVLRTRTPPEPSRPSRACRACQYRRVCPYSQE